MAKPLNRHWVSFEARSVALFAALTIGAAGAAQQANGQGQRQATGTQQNTMKLQAERIQPDARRMPLRRVQG
jgi:hypothetical protein